jgi:putative ABC transport system permease protein
MIRLEPGADPTAVAVEIMQTVPGVTPIQSPELFQSFRRQMSGLLRGVTAIMSVTWALTVLLVGLVFSMAANERRREIGVLRALGASRRYVFQTLLAEAALLAAVGAGAGIALGGVATYLFHSLIVSTLEMPFLLPSAGELITLVLGGLVIALASVALAALLPALRVSRQDAAVAMRE